MQNGLKTSSLKSQQHFKKFPNWTHSEQKSSCVSQEKCPAKNALNEVSEKRGLIYSCERLLVSWDSYTLEITA